MGLEDFLAHLAAFDPIVAVASDYVSRFLIRENLQSAAASTAPSRQGAIAIVPVQGLLIPKGGRSAYGGWQGMDSLRSTIRGHANDPDVAAIVLDVDSPGGTVAGTVQTADEVAKAAQLKPVVAVGNTLVGSAAYWIASQASQFVATPGSDIGSIGAMVMHVDISKALEDFGVRISMIRSAENKNETAPFGPLSDEAKAHLQTRVAEAGDEFIKAVAAGRRTSQTNVRDNFGKGRVFSSSQAVKLGMVDRVATLDETIAGLAAGVQSRASRKRATAAFG